jgi:hypothetical protein
MERKPKNTLMATLPRMSLYNWYSRYVTKEISITSTQEICKKPMEKSNLIQCIVNVYYVIIKCTCFLLNFSCFQTAGKIVG